MSFKSCFREMDGQKVDSDFDSNSVVHMGHRQTTTKYNYPLVKRVFDGNQGVERGKKLGNWNWWLPFAGVQRHPPALAEYLGGDDLAVSTSAAQDTDVSVGGKR